MLTQDKLPPYNHLIIIGNGFDLNLGLPTSYSDYMDSKYFNELLNGNGLTNGNMICVALKEGKGLNNWIDVENDLKRISKSLAGRKEFKDEFNELKNSLVAYFREYLESASFDTNTIAYEFICSNNIENSLIIDFNYTDSVSSLIKVSKNLSEDEIAQRVIKIHGSWKNNDIILGVEDGAEIAGGHHYIQKANHINYEGFDLKRLLVNINKLTVFGHSLGPTDHMYFKPFFQERSGYYESPGDGIFELYHYGQQSFDELMGNIKILTDDNTSKFRQNLNFIPIDSSRK